MKYFIIALALLTALPGFAQKKVIPFSQSALTGISLPEGSKKDNRALSQLSGKILLDMEAKKENRKVGVMEIFYLPSVESRGFTADSLAARITAAGWEIIPVEGDDKFAWLQKDDRLVLAYFSMDKKETNLYFGEAIL